MLYLRFLFQSDLVRYLNVYIVIISRVMMIFLLRYAYLVHFLGQKKKKVISHLTLQPSIWLFSAILDFRLENKNTVKVTTSATG